MLKTRIFLFAFACLAIGTTVCSLPLLAQSMSKYALETEAPDAQMTRSNDEKISLSNFFEKKRVILLFVPPSYESAAGKYLKGLEINQNSLKERDVALFAIVAAESPLLKESYGEDITVAASCDPMPTSMSPNFDNGPLFVLIGKDRTIKLREPNFVDQKAFCNVIDAMPQRRAEMKEKEKEKAKVKADKTKKISAL